MEAKEENGKGTSLRQSVIESLLAGQVLTVKKICEQYSLTVMQTGGSVLRSIFYSEFGDLYMKRGDFKDPDSGRLAYNYYIPEYLELTGVKFSDVELSINTAVKLSRKPSATPPVKKKVGKRSPTPKQVPTEQLTLEPIIRDVVLNLILKIKVEII